MTRVFGILWHILWELVAVAVVLALLKAASSQFETIVICGLTLIYLTVVGAHSSLGMGMVESEMRRSQQFAVILKSLNHPEIETLSEPLREQAEQLKKTTTNFYISSFFQLILFVITMWNLLKAIEMI